MARTLARIKSTSRCRCSSKCVGAFNESTHMTSVLRRKGMEVTFLRRWTRCGQKKAKGRGEDTRCGRTRAGGESKFAVPIHVPRDVEALDGIFHHVTSQADGQFLDGLNELGHEGAGDDLRQAPLEQAAVLLAKLDQ